MRALLLLSVSLVCFWAQGAAAQTILDRVDPAEVQPEPQPEGIKEADPAIRIETPPNAVPADDAPTYAVGAVAMTGMRALTPEVFVDIVQRYSGRNMSGAQLGELTDAIARRARDRGYPFATASIAPQQLDTGVVFVAVDEGVVDRIDVSGADTAAIRATLAPLADGEPVTLDALERRLLLVGDIEGVRVRRARYERMDGQGVLLVETRQDRASARIRLENDGSRPIGPEQARIDVDLNGLLASDDSVSFTYSTTPFEPEELQYGRVRYVIRAGNAGTEIGVGGTFSSTIPGAYLADREIYGRSWRAEINIRHPILRRRAASLWLEGAIELSDLRQERDDLIARHDRVAALRAGIYGLGDVADGRLRGRVALSQGLDAFDATQRGDPLASREDASPTFTVLSAWLDWTRAVGGDFSLRLSGIGQLSTEPLLISEDIGLGGTRYLRGYNYSERSGDQGVIGAGELRYDWQRPIGLMRRAQLYAFADAGVVGNLRDGRGSGSLASSGGGVRTAITRDLDLNLQLAFPLTGERYDTDDMTPRFNFQVSQSF